MSIFKKTMRALGFSGEDDELESQPYTAENITNACTREKEHSADNTTDAPPQPVPSRDAGKKPVDEPVEMQLPDTLLEVLVEMLNRSLPDYVVAAIDKDTEKKYLFEQLDEPFKKFVSDVNEQSREWTARQWENKHKSLTREVEETRAKMKELEEQRNTMQSAQLSAERQKRAVTEKVHELEARVATLEAEKEQFELENKSLVNKLKVSNVHQEELDSAFAEITKLKGELKKQADHTAETEQLRTELQQVRDELAQARQDLEQARNNEQTATTQLTETQQQLAQQQGEVTQLAKQKQMLEAELVEAQNGLKVVEEVDAKLKQFEQVKALKDEKIAQLSQEVQTLGTANARLQTRLSEMAQRNERLESQSQEQTENKAVLETLRADLESANALVAALRNQRQELLAQIETLQQVKPAEDKGPVPAEKSDEPAVISFDAPQQNESEAEQTVSAPAAEPVLASESIEQPTENPKSAESSKPEKKHRRKTKAPEPVEESADDDFPGLDTFGDNWLIPTRPDTPEMIAKRKEEEKKKREAEERAAMEQKKSQQVDPSQMSLW